MWMYLIGVMWVDWWGDFLDIFWWVMLVFMSLYGKGFDMRLFVRNLVLGYFGFGYDGCFGLVFSCLVGVGIVLLVLVSMFFWLLCSFEVRGRV